MFCDHLICSDQGIKALYIWLGQEAEAFLCDHCYPKIAKLEQTLSVTTRAIDQLDTPFPTAVWQEEELLHLTFLRHTGDILVVYTLLSFYLEILEQLEVRLSQTWRSHQYLSDSIETVLKNLKLLVKLDDGRSRLDERISTSKYSVC